MISFKQFISEQRKVGQTERKLKVTGGKTEVKINPDSEDLKESETKED